MTGIPAPELHTASRPMWGQQALAAAQLALLLESHLAGTAPRLGGDRRRVTIDAWTAWWICFRARATSARLDRLTAGRTGACADCLADIAELTQRRPAHPDALGPRSCRCLTIWARAFRRTQRQPPWHHLSITIAMIKPGADQHRIRHLLGANYRIIDEHQRQLTGDDVRGLYPAAYGTEYVRAQDAYLTSAPVRVLTLHAPVDTDPTRIKLAVRGAVHCSDPLRNALHMPDNPGETLCDLAHLTGPATMRTLYERYDRDRSEQRRGHYRAVLAQR